MVNDKIKAIVSNLKAATHNWVSNIQKQPDTEVFLAHMNPIPDFEQVKIAEEPVKKAEGEELEELPDTNGKILFKNIEEIPQ